MAEIRVHDLVKRYAEVPAVNRISFRVREGEFCVLLGPSGCGKTTTLRCIAGLERPDGGELWIGGRLMNDGGTFVPPEQRGLGMVFQTYAIWPHMTVLENIAYGLSGRPGLNGDDIRKRALEALALVKLSGMEDRSATKLSGGQQQRVAACIQRGGLVIVPVFYRRLRASDAVRAGLETFGFEHAHGVRRREKIDQRLRCLRLS